MKQITINDERRLSQSTIVIGYLNENKVEQLQFIIPEKYKNHGKKACFRANNVSFAVLFDDVTSNVLTITKEISKYKELDMTIEFFAAQPEQEVARHQRDRTKKLQGVRQKCAGRTLFSAIKDFFSWFQSLAY